MSSVKIPCPGEGSAVFAGRCPFCGSEIFATCRGAQFTHAATCPVGFLQIATSMTERIRTLGRYTT